MKRGATHAAGLYNYPDDGNQFNNGCQVVWDLGLRLIKLWATSDYATKYPEQSAWSSTPTTLTELVQTTQFATELARGWNTIVLTTLTFANGTNNWWRSNPSAAKMQDEYDELRAMVEHLLGELDGTDTTDLVIQNWEGDWAFMDGSAGGPNRHVPAYMVARYGAFLGKRQAAVADARAAVSSTCRVRHAVEVNRVLDSRLYPHRRRILTDLSQFVRPDIISYSAYDSTTDALVLPSIWGTTVEEWEAAARPAFRKGMRIIQNKFGNADLQIGEAGFPEQEVPGTYAGGADDVATMIGVVDEEAEAAGAISHIYWQTFDNEPNGAKSPPYRGYWLMKPDGTDTVASAALEALGPGE